MRYNPHRPDRKGKTRFNVALAQRSRAQRGPAVRLPPASGVVVVVLLVLIVIGATTAWFFGRDWRIDKIDVQNNGGVPVEAIIGASALQGEHFQFVDLDLAAKRVDDLPGVEAARVTCHWMWRTDCTILVQPARAMAMWETPHGNLWNDYEGKLQLANDNVSAVVYVRVEDGDPLALGQSLDRRLLRALNELIASQPDVKQYVYSQQYGLVWINEDKQRVRLGWAEYDGVMNTKLKLARALHKQLSAQGMNVSVLDVRFAEAPYYIR